MAKKKRENISIGGSIKEFFINYKDKEKLKVYFMECSRFWNKNCKKKIKMCYQEIQKFRIYNTIAVKFRNFLQIIMRLLHYHWHMSNEDKLPVETKNKRKCWNIWYLLMTLNRRLQSKKKSKFDSVYFLSFNWVATSKISWKIVVSITNPTNQ